ncbi:MAG: cytochrome c biogenesis protein [Myxococcales bacterium]|nr:cytochrome c biogenesis protein [Myxococcales bacterium]
MLVSALFVLAAILYALACAFYLRFLVRGAQKGSVWSGRVLGAAVGSQLGFYVADFLAAGHLPFGDIHRALSNLTLVTVVAFLLLGLRYRQVNVLGAFLTPIALLFFLGSALGRSVEPVPEEVRSLLMPVHVGVNLLGVVAFALAFAFGVAYILQERLLRRKKLGGLFQRLPSLDVLDTFGLRAVLIGFPLLTLGIVTGAFWAFRMGPEGPSFVPQQAFAVLAWLVFGAVLLLRVAAGWRGRRAAIGTIVGFCCAAAVLVSYLVQAGESAS